jgi:hypothetical protein
MRTLHLHWTRPLKILCMASADESGPSREKLESAAEESLHQEIARARALVMQIASTGVKFPAEIHETLERASAAQRENRWTLQVDRQFYGVLSLLESITRAQLDEAQQRQHTSAARATDNDERGWTTIISNRRKVQDGDW